MSSGGRASDYHWCGNYACYKCGELETSGRRDARPQPQSQRTYGYSRVVKEERSETEEETEESEECEEYEVEEEEYPEFEEY